MVSSYYIDRTRSILHILQLVISENINLPSHPRDQDWSLPPEMDCCPEKKPVNSCWCWKMNAHTAQIRIDFTPHHSMVIWLLQIHHRSFRDAGAFDRHSSSEIPRAWLCNPIAQFVTLCNFKRLLDLRDCERLKQHSLFKWTNFVIPKHWTNYVVKRNHEHPSKIETCTSQLANERDKP